MINIKLTPINKFKTFKFDAAPFFFFIDIFPPEYSNKDKPNLVHLINSLETNPIMPLPMRIDRVFNGERSVLIRPKEPISFPITEDLTAIIDPLPFLKYGFEKLLYFTEVRSHEKFLLSLSYERVSKWWDFTKSLYGNLTGLEEDFSAFLKAYLHFVIKAKINEEDFIKAAINYCQLVSDICKKRLEQNIILTNIDGKQENVKMYRIKEATYYRKFKKSKETEYHPELIDIEIYDLSNIGFSKVYNEQSIILTDLESKVIKYIPLLFYDDLFECMLQNMKRLENNEKQPIDPSFLLDNKIVITQNTNDLENMSIKNFSWWSSFDEIDFNSILESIRKTHESFFLALDVEK